MSELQHLVPPFPPAPAQEGWVNPPDLNKDLCFCVLGGAMTSISAWPDGQGGRSAVLAMRPGHGPSNRPGMYVTDPAVDEVWFDLPRAPLHDDIYPRARQFRVTHNVYIGTVEGIVDTFRRDLIRMLSCGPFVSGDQNLISPVYGASTVGEACYRAEQAEMRRIMAADPGADRYNNGCVVLPTTLNTEELARYDAALATFAERGRAQEPDSTPFVESPPLPRERVVEL